jgi:hypothetical protein
LNVTFLSLLITVSFSFSNWANEEAQTRSKRYKSGLVAILTWAKVVEDEILSASFHGSIKLRSFFVHEEKKKAIVS